MLGFDYVVAKSRELSSALDRELSAASNRSTSFRSVFSNSSVEIAASNAVPVAADAFTLSPPSVRTEGQTFLHAQQNLHAQSVINHHRLMQSGQELDAALSHARVTLQDQVLSEQFLSQNFHLVSRVRQQLTGVRELILKVAGEADEVEKLLVQRGEEKVALQNAEFAAKQQQELENFESRIAQESEDRKCELLEMKRQKLASAFMNDLRMYQSLVADHGHVAAMKAKVRKDEQEKVTLDDVDLIVTADTEQLDTFYDSASEEDEDKLQNLQLRTQLVPKELVEEKEAKSEERSKGAGKGEACIGSDCASTCLV